LVVDEFSRTQQSTIIWEEDLWNVLYLEYLGEEGEFGEEGVEDNLVKE
jgi:hypothetical protein